MRIAPKITTTTLKSAKKGELLRLDLAEGPFLAFVVGGDVRSTHVVLIGLEGDAKFYHVRIERDEEAWSFGFDWMFEITSIGARFVESKLATKTVGLLAVENDRPAISVIDQTYHNDVIYWDLINGTALNATSHKALTTASWRLWATPEERSCGVAMPLYDTDEKLQESDE